jgi:uncharacterized integral membrane protein (TIGR00697 family)
MFQSKKDLVYVVLAGIFITNAVTAEMIGSKLINIGPFVMSVGILPWPVVFVTTDLINEYFGKDGVKKLSLITAALIAYCFVILCLAMYIPSSTTIPSVKDSEFNAVFGQSTWIIIGSLVAFLASQLIDASIFHFFKSKTGNNMIWLRSTGSTVISQFFDSFIVLGIAFYMTGKMSFDQYITSGFTGYFVKLIIAILLTPLIYLGHALIKKYLAK